MVFSRGIVKGYCWQQRLRVDYILERLFRYRFPSTYIIGVCEANAFMPLFINTYLEKEILNMKLVNYNLKVGNKTLLENINLSFKSNVINHILGSNGAGKSSFAKSCVGMLKYEGKISGNSGAILIGSGSNVPSEFTIDDLLELLKKRFEPQKVKGLYDLLKLNTVSGKLQIKKMSDGQKQKIKLLAFLSEDPKVIILDEFTNALDKNSALDLYHFFNEYNKMHDVVIINITHNLSDLEYMEGKYYYICNRSITEVETKEEIINLYVKGE